VAHWAEIDENGIVLRVVVGDNNDPNGDEGYQWLLDNLGGTWIKTSYNANIRERFAGIGSFYDSTLDIFLPRKRYPSWIVSPEKRDWVAPVAKPDSGIWDWNEDTLSWNEHEVE
jgi:hypothetical protein